LEQPAQGSGGVPIPGGVQKTCRYGTSGHGLSRQGGDRLTVELDELGGLFQP